MLDNKDMLCIYSVLSNLCFISDIAISGAVDDSVIIKLLLPFIVIAPNTLTFILSAFTSDVCFFPFLLNVLVV